MEELSGITFHLNGQVYNIELGVVFSLIVCALLIAVAIAFNRSLAKADPAKPTKGLVKYGLLIIDSISSIFSMADGEGLISRNEKQFLFGISVYVFAVNLLPLFGLTAPMSNITVAITISWMALIYVYWRGLVAFNYNPFKYVGSWAELKWMLPFEILGKLIPFLSLPLRIFGNMLAGMIIITLIENVFIVLIGVPLLAVGADAIVKPLFDIFTPLLQAFVYTMLLSIYLVQVKEHASHSHDEALS